MNIPEIVQAAKTVQNLTSDQALADMLGVSDVAVMRWRRGHSLPKIHHAHELAVLAEIDPAAVVAEVLVESEKSPEVRKTLERLKSALATAALIVMAMTPFTSQATDLIDNDEISALNSNLSIIYIIRISVVTVLKRIYQLFRPGRVVLWGAN